MPGKARHPRSRGERALLDALDETLNAALAICDASTVAEDVLSMEPCNTRDDHSEHAAARAPLESNSTSHAALFYDLEGSMLSIHGKPAIPQEPRLYEHDAGHTTEYVRSLQLGDVSDYMPPYRDTTGSKVRLDNIIMRMQQYQTAQNIQNSLRASRPDAAWNWIDSKYHLEPVTKTNRSIGVDTWASFYRQGGDPVTEGLGFEIVPNIRACRYLG